MARDISPEEAFDEAVYELTVKHYGKLSRKLQAGDKDLASAIDDAISHELDEAFWRELVIDAAHPTRDALIGARFRKLVEKALQARAEVLAIAEAEQQERDRKESQDEARAERALSQ